MMTKLWLDDCRPAPEGWYWAKSVPAAQLIMLNYEVEQCSLDHDLGAGCVNCYRQANDQYYEVCDRDCEHSCHLTGYDFVKWMAEVCIWPAQRPTVHSSNPVGRDNMEAFINSEGPY